MNTCTTHFIEWDHTQEDYITLPKSCLSYNVMNQGGSRVTIDDAISIDPREIYTTSYHDGYFHTGKIKLEVANSQAPYSMNTKVIVKLVVSTAKDK